MGFISSIFSGIVNFIKRAWNAIKKFFVAVLNLFKHVVAYFREKVLNRNKHKPFIGDLQKVLKEGLQDAPTRNLGIFRGVYNSETDEIEDLDVVETGQLDQGTKDILQNDPLVLLT